MTLIVVYICSAALARGECGEATARAVYRARSETLLCLPHTLPAAGSAAADAGEFARVRCVIR